MYEKLLAEKANRGIQVQGMLEPYSFEVTPPQDEMLKSEAAQLQDFGFTIESVRGADLSGAGRAVGTERRATGWKP